MIIKKFTGKTEEEALMAANKELGDGIVTMNVKTVKAKGLAGFFGGKVTEVTVALEEESDGVGGVRRETASGIRKISPQKTSSQSAAPGQEWLSSGFVDESSQSIERKLDSLQTLLVNRLQQEESAREESSDKREEDAGSEVQEEPEKQPTEQEKFMRLLYNTMLENEVDEKYANQIINDVDKADKPSIPIDYILSNVYQKMILKFNKAEGITPSDKGPKVVLFMGPTGVGKTTTIAKIASSFTMDEKKTVALLTADTYRIAAAEQLRTYAGILEVPFRVIYTPEEIGAAISDFSGFDYIFVDTMGHSHQNEEQMENMKELLDTVSRTAEFQTFLVMSATTKYKDLLRIAASYQGLTDYQLIFTKLDETASLGNLLNVRLDTDMPIAFVTCGQNVPDDIELFDPQKTVKQLLSMKH